MTYIVIETAQYAVGKQYHVEVDVTVTSRGAQESSRSRARSKWKPYDIIFMDNVMPALNGVDILRNGSISTDSASMQSLDDEHDRESDYLSG